MKFRVIINFLFVWGISLSLKAQKFAFFDHVDVDSGAYIVGFYSGPVPQPTKQFAFIVKTADDFNQLKMDWVFEKTFSGKKPDNSIAIYRVKNKTGEWLGTIYPDMNRITNVRGSFIFDTSKLTVLAKSHPFHSHIKRETFKTREEYFNSYNKEILEKDYLFSFGPGKWDGTFKITIPVSDSTATPVAAIDMLTTKLSAITDPANYSLRYELTADNRDYAKSYKITVDCIRLLYEKYNDAVYLKSDWKPEPMFMTSFWKD